MINFRFHIASLIAVFLALAVGVVMGSTVVQRAIVEGLRARIDTVENKANAQRADNAALRSQLEQLRQYVDESAAQTVSGSLTDQRAVVVAARGVDEGAVQDQVALLRQAGARVPGILWLEDSWSLTEDGQAELLRAAVGSTARSERAVREDALGALARRLASVPAPGQPDVLARLVDAGFVQLEGVGDQNGTPTASAYVGESPRVLFLGGPAAAKSGAGFARAVTRALVAANDPTTVGEVLAQEDGGPPRGTWLAAVRDDAQLADAVSTVDDVDLAEGRVAAALALADLARGIVGHYGFGAGADRQLPEVRAAAAASAP